MYVNPYEVISKEEGEWLKANFHVHARAKGCEESCDVADVISLYKEAGYDVLTVSNQNTYTDTQKLALKHDIATINGIEYIEKDGILCIGIKSFIKGKPQEVINNCLEQGGFSIICHPNWETSPTLPAKLNRRETKELSGYIGIEILTPVIFNRFQGSGLATDFWDELLSEKKLIWGFANDDFHKWFDMDRAWNVIYSKSRRYEDIKASVEQGSFYASTGLVLEYFLFENGIVRTAANLRHTHAKNIRYEFVGENGKVLYEYTGDCSEYRVNGDEPYVRVQASSEHGAMLWTQPLYNNELFCRCL